MSNQPQTVPQFKMVAEWRNGNVTAEWHDAPTMASELRKMAKLLTNLSPGEKFTVERIS